MMNKIVLSFNKEPKNSIFNNYQMNL